MAPAPKPAPWWPALFEAPLSVWKADVAKTVAVAVAREREACARIVEKAKGGTRIDKLAAKIRARR